MTIQEMMIDEIKNSKFAEEFEEGELEGMGDGELLFNYTGVIRHQSWEQGYLNGYSAGYEVYSAENGDDGMLKVQVQSINESDGTIEGNPV